MKVLKWILLGVVAVVVIVVGYLTLLLDPNDFKPQIVAAVEKQTGRQFKIDKDLGWTFFPSIGITAGGISLSNPSTFNEPTFAAVNAIVANVELMPLFSKQVKISELVLDGLHINLITDKQGKTSLDGLTGQSDTKAAAPAEVASATTNDSVSLNDLSIGGVSVTDAKIRVIDQRTGAKSTFTLERFKLGELTLDKFAAMDYRLSAALDGMSVESEGHGQLKIAKDLKLFSLKELSLSTVAKGESLPTGKIENSITLDAEVDTSKSIASTSIKQLKLNDISGSGKLDVNYAATVPAISAKLALGDIDVDKWLPAAETATAEQPQATTTANATPATEPDLTGMKAVNADFELTIAEIKAAGTTSKNWKMVIALKNGVMNMKQLSADLYDGSLNANATVDGRNRVAKYSFDTQIKSINIRALLTDAAEIELLDGTADIGIKGNGTSLIPDNIKKQLNANGQFAINNGAVHGVNVPQMIRAAQAKLKGESTTENEAKKTDFTSLTGSFSVANGVANNPDLLMSSPLIRISGKGDANIIEESLDYKLSTALVNTLKGQGGKEVDDLAGVEIPLAIKGSFSDPKFSLDMDALLKNKVKQEADKAKDKLKDSLFKKLGL
ncbi:AsmA family protein [Shewanella avicenniae]|uniref:AsmA family protein n=1 Tax=Shewanella avicenniae TaxID=2814294 RepID=A0ABX7QXE6_9GAMM|nr:AsmA family protein [Shewanella avicenniae]QSX35303.1 AsmA family protein [Shewanella avicenniae]